MLFRKIKLFGLFTAIALIFPGVSLAATLSLSPVSGTFNPGCSFSVDLKLDTTGSSTSGTDAIVKYDNTKLTANSITIGQVYSDYPAQLIDSQSGKISISGVSSASQTPFSGAGTFATVNFSVLGTAPTGATAVTFDFTPGSTTDSNVVDSQTITDVLSSVTNGNYTVGTGACGAVASATPSSLGGGVGGATGSGALATPLPTLPKAGEGLPTLVITTAGILLTVLGVLGLALL